MAAVLVACVWDFRMDVVTGTIGMIFVTHSGRIRDRSRWEGTGDLGAQVFPESSIGSGLMVACGEISF
jgi:hypothetical protein